jgi:chromosome segregation ATPase
MDKLTILELNVSGYERLALSDTKEFNITPENIHLILGTNGSGKSSLMELLTPLPPNSRDFKEDGFKEIKLKLGNDIYVIYSTNNKHSMRKNNDIILDSVGIQMMTEYVGEIFKITPNIHKFMLGRVSMCSMSLQNRKEFITNISGIDFDYVNKLYNNLKKKLRDNIGVVKYINNNILSMKEYILSDTEVEALQNDRNEIKRLLVRLHENKRADKTLINVSKPDMIRIMKRVDEVVDSLKEYDMDIDKTKSKYLLHSAILEEQNRKLITISNTLTKLNDSNSSKVLDRLKELSDRVSTIRKSLTLPIDYLADVVERLERRYDVTTAMSNISDLSLQLSGETKNSISENIKDIDSKLIELSRKQKEIITDVDNTSIKITTYRSAMNGLSCPDCGFHFKEDSVSDIIKKLESHIEDLHNPKNKIDNEIKEYELILNDLKEKLKLRDRLEDLLDYIIPSNSKPYIEDNIFIPIFECWENYSKTYTYSIRLTNDIKYYRELVELEAEYNELSKKDITNKEEEIINLTKEYDNLSQSITDISTSISNMKKILDNHNQMSNDLISINKYLSDVNKNRRFKIQSLFNKASNDIIFELNNKLSRIESVLDKYNYMSKSTDENLKELDKVNKDIELLEIVIKELSPSTGLIAESIKSFLLGYIKDVNKIISSVWSYDMEVLPYDVKELEKGISYRFPVRVNDQKPVSDINDTSESMREIINLAFRIVSLKYMGLLKYPLMIDEFGRSMDEVHLIKSYDLLESICLENDIQMFIIAHIKSAYNRFKNSGMSIVSNLNLEDME